MFSNCYKLERKDLSGFDIRTTADYEYATWCSYEECIKTAVKSVKFTYFSLAYN